MKYVLPKALKRSPPLTRERLSNKWDYRQMSSSFTWQYLRYLLKNNAGVKRNVLVQCDLIDGMIIFLLVSIVFLVAKNKAILLDGVKM